ncbi:MAG TPA: NAD(P)H-dependent glycerol-3-phosphate dehydrogenase [Bacilli bacterium]|jgi:glycerol-3-phosphate dehydrogenase (NAD(P)+)|nr:NAD(P)H-dependent glycerol-3-phosphate dehydrogenase [Acholeplasmataceae bacterium]HOA78511.1 NAD(P)H-dependent glycerol-3-phosphate dehydrogenase [Bacilli bacterium]HPZ27463.1 NAD(P)H-dependent glycerol-3-phosphate dehydrogenase [Bacilli bacterium]HQC89833.1 NAD(P)H-dependent glycerol-3-phosphate dehydrogenase [Bacilli bacterium]
MTERITIIGAGSWGSGLARLVSDNGYRVMMYDVDPDIVNEINLYHTNKTKLPAGTLNENVSATTDIGEAVDFGDIIVLVVPTKVIRGALRAVGGVIRGKKLFVNASKGIEPDTFKRVSEIVYEEIPEEYIEGFVALSGPSHAEEVILQMLTLVTAASPNIEHARLVQRVFSNQTYFRVYTVTDLIGVEICASLKNIIAIASGIIAGLGYGDNTRAALVTRGLVEMGRIARTLGAEEKTIYGLAGLGDLVVTCTSLHSRNYQAGYKIGSGKDLEQALAEMTMVVEGARSAVAAHQIIKRHNIYAPIIEAVYDIIYNKQDPRKRIMKMMQSDLKEE